MLMTVLCSSRERPSRASKEINRQLVELVELLQLRPVSALSEDVQLDLRDLFEGHQRTVERIHAVLPTPDEKYPLAQLVHLTPHHAEFEVGAREGLTHRPSSGERFRRAGAREAR